MKFERVLFADKKIVDLELVSFVAGCLRETGGVPSVSECLAELGYRDFHEYAFGVLEEAKESKCLNLMEYDSLQIKKICRAVVEELEECQDLDILLGVELEDAISLIDRV